MLRAGLLLIGLTVVELGLGQSSDPQAAAPVVYSDATAASPDCTSENDAVACNPEDQELEDDSAVSSSDEDDLAYDAPVYDDYVDFYPGVSLLPVDYWAPDFAWGWGWPYYAPYGFGWSYYGLAGFGWGWPYLGFSWSWGGHHHHHHDGWGGGHHHHSYAWRPYHGPYRYYGHGRYADGHHPAGTHGNRSIVAATNRLPIGGRTNTPVPTSNPARIGNRAALASSSYYAFAQRGGAAPIRPVENMSGQPGMIDRASGNRGVTNGRDSRYWVTSLPSRGYAHASRYAPSTGAARYAPSTARRTSSAPYPHMLPGYAPRHDYAARPYAAQPRYAGPHYSAPRSYSAPSTYSRGGGGAHVSTHAGGGSTSRSSGGSHASTGLRRMH